MGIGVLAVALLVLYGHLSGEDFARSAAEMDARFLPVALALHVTAHLFWAARYSLLAGPFGLPIRFLRAWRIVTAGVFGGAVTPGRIGGEAVKMTLLLRQGASAGQASRLLLLDRSMDLLFFLAAGALAVVVLPTAYASGATAQKYALAGIGVLAALLALLLALLLMPRLVAHAAARGAQWWDRLRRRGARDPAAAVEAFLRDVRTGVLGSFRHRPGRMAAAMGLTLCNWLAEYAALWMVLRGFGIHLPYVTVFLAGVVLTLVSNIPITPGGTGVAEVTALLLFGPLAGGVSVLLPIAWRSTTYMYDLAAGGPVAAVSLARRQALPSPGRGDVG